MQQRLDSTICHMIEAKGVVTIGVFGLVLGHARPNDVEAHQSHSTSRMNSNIFVSNQVSYLIWTPLVVTFEQL